MLAVQVSLFWLELGWGERNSAQTYASTQSAADAQRRLQTWLALAPCGLAVRLTLLILQASSVDH